MAKLAEQAKRYKKMVQSMGKVIVEAEEPPVEECNILSIAYQNVISAGYCSSGIGSNPSYPPRACT